MDLPEPGTQVPANGAPESLLVLGSGLESLEHPEQSVIGAPFLAQGESSFEPRPAESRRDLSRSVMARASDSRDF